MTTWLDTFATIDRLQATIDLRDQSVVALVIENSKLRRQVAELTGELGEARAQLAWQAQR